MTVADRPRPLKEANRITQLLDAYHGADRFDRHPVDMQFLALEYSKQIAPQSPIVTVEERNLKGCMGALVYSETKPRQWGIAYHKNQSPGRKAFTLGHEFGHYILHRDLIESDEQYDGGVYCDEESILQRNGKGIEKEADEFAATLLMPFHDFRRQLPANERPDFKRLSALAKRYGVSLTAAILRWLEYTETRAMMVVSNEGFALWARSSDPALKSGRFIRTKDTVFELPAAASAKRRLFTEETKAGLVQPAEAWGFPEGLLEMCIRSERYDQEITLLHFEGSAPIFFRDEADLEDTYDRFVKNGQTPAMPLRQDRGFGSRR
ncbi:ImmA/IrrE family metallo-endopeptidase [Bradyrhizobium niftali]|uniref:ImmA/IrrE family metallo-endopeptidase n=1 Tax=Bradyrhizobium niftali TaxID=2560055 RepID=A0A4Y9LMW8_9BRAD|nr:ImmA/IrrE family metallo-endopeptidase [Bradyrhizobium niftali]TFV43373.1 ImmA/IrrE family metallo-endopeptidase [Bradyrhizobium niftali]